MATVIVHSDTSADSEPGLRPRIAAHLLGGNTCIHEGLLAPKELVPPHTHANEDQCLYVVWGLVHLEVGGEFIEAPTGTFVIKPRGVPHALWNPGTAPTLVLEVSSPGGFASFYDEMATARTEVERESLMNKYGMTFHTDLIPELQRRHGLS